MPEINMNRRNNDFPIDFRQSPKSNIKHIGTGRNGNYGSSEKQSTAHENKFFFFF